MHAAVYMVTRHGHCKSAQDVARIHSRYEHARAPALIFGRAQVDLRRKFIATRERKAPPALSPKYKRHEWNNWSELDSKRRYNFNADSKRYRSSLTLTIHNITTKKGFA